MATEEAGVKIKTEVDSKGVDGLASKIKGLKNQSEALGKSGKGAFAQFQSGLQSSIALTKQMDTELEKARQETKRLGDEAKKTQVKLVEAATKARGAFVDKLRDTGKSGALGFQSYAKTGALAITAGVGAIVAGNMQAEKSFRKLSFSMEASGKAGVKWNDLQRQAFAVSQKWGGSQEELAAGATAALEKSGSGDFALDSLEAIAQASRATGLEMGSLGELAGELNSKFGVSAKDLPTAFAGIAEMAAKGGQSIEEITAEMDALGKASARAGIEGVDGLKQMIALSQKMADAAGGETAAMGKLSKVLVDLGPAADAKTKAQLKKMGVKGDSGMEVLGSLMQQTGGDETKLAAVLGPEKAALLSQGLGATGFGEAMKASKTTMSAGRIGEIASDAMEAPGAKIEKALNTIAERLSQPDFTNAIGQLAKELPRLAEAVVKAVGWVGENPELAAGGFVATQAIGPALGAAALGKQLLDWRGAAGAAKAGQTAVAAASGGGAVATTAANAGLTAVGTAGTTAAGGIGTFAKQLGAAGLAVGALALAFDQGIKLIEELDDEHDTDMKAIENFTKVSDKAAEEGDVEKLKILQTTKLNQMAEMTSGKGTFDPEAFGDLVFEVGLLGTKIKRAEGVNRANAVEEDFRKQNPEWVGPDGRTRTADEMIAIQASTGAAGSSVGASIGADIGKAPPAAKGMSPGDKALFDAMVNGNKELPSKLGAIEMRVRVVNAEDIRGGNAPGYIQRD